MNLLDLYRRFETYIGDMLLEREKRMTCYDSGDSNSLGIGHESISGMCSLCGSRIDYSDDDCSGLCLQCQMFRTQQGYEEWKMYGGEEGVEE